MTAKKNIPFVVRRSAIQGLGAVATRDLKKGTKIIEYQGERITDDEAQERYNDESMKRHHTFLFDLDGEWCIDGNVNGNEARFINHSCASNCEALTDGKRVFIHARKNIKKGEELLYDYGYRMDISERMAKREYPCHCGSEKCRGTIVFLPKKRRSVKKRPAKKTSKKKSAKA